MCKDYKSQVYLDYRIFNPEFEKKFTLWLPGVKSTYQEGKSFIFRMLPALAANDGSESDEVYVPGRDPTTGELSVEMLHPVGYIDQFGSKMRKVSFIPQALNKRQGEELPYARPDNNPLALLRSGLWSAHKAKALPTKWTPLIWSQNTVRTELSAAGYSSQFARPLLPRLATKYFCYVWVYAGYDLKEESYIQSPSDPIGSKASHGLQVALLTDQISDKLAKDYLQQEKIRGRLSSEFQCPDPALPNDGCLNYVWNKEKPNPITGEVITAETFGYTATESVDFYKSPRDSVEVDLTFSPQFDEWYYSNWEWWDDVLQSTTGVDQVQLIAEYFPELGVVCRQIWSGHDELLEAVERAPFSFDEDIDFWDVIVATQTQSHRNEQSSSRGKTATDSDFTEEDYEPRRPERRDRSHRNSKFETEENFQESSTESSPFSEEDGEEDSLEIRRTRPTVNRRTNQESQELDDEKKSQRHSVRSAVASKMRQQRVPDPQEDDNDDFYDESDYEEESF